MKALLGLGDERAFIGPAGMPGEKGGEFGKARLFAVGDGRTPEQVALQQGLVQRPQQNLGIAELAFIGEIKGGLHHRRGGEGWARLLHIVLGPELARLGKRPSAKQDAGEKAGGEKLERAGAHHVMGLLTGPSRKHHPKGPPESGQRAAAHSCVTFLGRLAAARP